jgi:YtkA-like
VRRSLLLTVLLALLAAPSALAGGWATVGLDSTPAGVEPGKPWNVDITVLQHGRTPLTGITPMVSIESGGVSKQFIAEPTGEPGVYRASVVFPSAGTWSYEVHDGFIDVPHTFPAVEISAPAAPESGIATGWLWGAGAALVLALALLGLDRRRRPATLPHAPEPAA